MPGNFRKDDLRVKKTRKAILESFFKLLERRSFGRIAVNDLCAEAGISRPTFYAHFKDKYDLLEFSLTKIIEEVNISTCNGSNYARIEMVVNQLVRENTKVISNVVKDADDETMDLLYTYLLLFLGITEEKSENGTLTPRYIVFSNFCVGGMMKLLLWQVDNKFSQDQQCINANIINLFMHTMAWKAGQDFIDGRNLPDDKPTQ